ncbi:MAG: class I SAM-dependent methyltransferase [Gammaproteobacteria bacterium]|nr:class I SAM-dependent methyltransferase [Gammaproteobacteria bacterium]
MQSSSPEAAAYDRWAEYYDLLDADRAPFIEFYNSLVNRDTQSVLELGCGTGTISIAMAAHLATLRGDASPARFVGVDGSEGMLKVARARASGIEWIFGDIRKPPVDGPFDLVFCCFNTLQHLLLDQDLVQAFVAARDLLAPTGIYAFDLYQPSLSWLAAEQPDRLARSVVDPEGRRLEIREDMRYDARTRIVDLNWRLVNADHPGQEPLASTSYRLRQHFAEDLMGQLEQAGLVVHARYGDFDKSGFNAQSRKQILVCGRA